MPAIGDKNIHGQRLVSQTGARGNHPYARVWALECGSCGQTYGANSCDFHIRRCPCQGGKAGLEVASA
jgi:hypothetical protein